jgi:diguanylate cyclase (GGDEF)-like protein
MSARFALRPTRPADPVRAGRAPLPGIGAYLRAFGGGAPIQLAAPLSGPIVVVAFGLAYLIALASAGPGAIALLGAPSFAAAVLLSGGLAAAVWTASLGATLAVLGPADAAAASSDVVAALIIVVSAVSLRAVVVLAVAARTDALNDEARLAQQRAAQLGVLQAASARLSRANGVEAIGRAIVEETRRIIDYHNARVYLIEGDEVVPFAFEGTVGAYEQVDLSLLRCKLGEGFTGWVGEHGVALLVGDANADPRGASIPGTDDVDESMLVVPMAYDGTTIGVITLSKLGFDQFDHEDERLLLILADQAATAIESARLLARSEALAGELRRLLYMSAELSTSLDSRQVAKLMADHFASAMGVDECAISYWDRQTDRLATLGYYPATPDEDLQPFFDLAAFPESRRVLDRQEAVSIDIEDPAADPAEIALLASEGYRSLTMLPLVAKGQSIGLVELISRSAAAFDAETLGLARTMANEAAMALENARLYEEARALADRDPLTGFYNHRYVHERFGEEVVRAQRSGRPLSVLMLDLDDFKLVNDTFGHLFGDRVLAWTAELIRANLRASDIPARYGGDEFAILLPEAGPEAAEQAAARIRDAFAAAAFAEGGRSAVPVSIAVGAATFPVDGRSATDLIATADRRLYEMKRGRPVPGASSAEATDATDATDTTAATATPAAATSRPVPARRKSRSRKSEAAQSSG